jgi:hypothetical protein
MSCVQITWGGRWQAGSGAITGEEMELCNAYLSTTGLTTKTMNKGGKYVYSHAHMHLVQRSAVDSVADTWQPRC